MPELPQVETCLRGLLPHVLNHRIKRVIIRQSQLRWPIPSALPEYLINQHFINLQRRGKYLLFEVSSHDTVLMHLGMSGRVRIVSIDAPLNKHDHVDIVFDNDTCLRFNDSRRFGAILWWQKELAQHPLLVNLGPEPLTLDFDEKYLYNALKNRKKAIKLSLMDNHLVVGIGNIYVNEILFLAGIHPLRPSNKITAADASRLVIQIKAILTKAIALGGTTLRDFLSVDGSPGYFQQTLYVYGRGNESCLKCQNTLVEIRLGQRSTVFCSTCQSK